ncbi:putative transcriptional regulatory protein [Lachnellula arida]|uniref:Putative transcriptional regulatory protein n=1 Tax=Lachnellula arida TaxID=1316785 RepID=A0A8T9BMM4_9HELO|nr:putative transcriptional regulatory protein [Lachnellula arida]
MDARQQSPTLSSSNSNSHADVIVVSSAQKPPGTQRAKRVDRACENCRRKRLKCTAEQHPCMNCLLYHAECVYGPSPKARASNNLPKPSTRTKKRKQSPVVESANTGNDTAVEQTEQSGGSHGVAEDRLSVGNSTISQHGREPTPGHSPSTGMEMPLQQHAEGLLRLDTDTIGDIRMGEIDNTMGIGLDDFDGMSDFLEGVPLQGSSLSDLAPLHEEASRHRSMPHDGSSRPSSEMLPDKESDGGVVGLQHFIRESSRRPDTQSVESIPPGLIVNMNDANGKFIGVNSTGATVASSLRYSIDGHGAIKECDVRDYLIGSVSHVDEMGVPPSTTHLDYRLPDQSAARQGVNCYFRNIHVHYPILNAQNFLDDWPRLYDPTPPKQNPVRYSRFFLIVAIGLLSQTQTPNLGLSVDDALPQELHHQAWRLLNDVLARPYAASVQVILLHQEWNGMGPLRNSHTNRPVRWFAPATLSRNELVGGRDTLEVTNMVATQGRPPAVSNTLCDMEVLPLLRNPDSPGDKLIRPAADIYYWHVKLAQIENSFCCLFSSAETGESRTAKVGDLDTALRRWRDEIPMEYRPDQEILADHEMYQSIAMIHLQFFNILRALHWASLSSAKHDVSALNSHQNPRIRSSEAICVASARSFVKILNDFHTDHYMAALSTLFQNIFKYPQKHSARTDLEILRAGQYHFERHVHPSRLNPQLSSLFRKMQIAAEDLLNKSSSTIRSVHRLSDTDKFKYYSDSGMQQSYYGNTKSPGMSFFDSMFSPRFPSFGEGHTNTLYNEVSL